MRVFKAGIAAMLWLAVAAPAESQAPAAPTLAYADLADLALTAPVAAHVRLARATRLRPEEAAGLPAGRTRFYVEADVVTLLRGASGLPARVSYLADLPNQSDGKPPRLRNRSEHIVLAARVPGRPGELRLAAPDAQLPYTAADLERVRALLREANAPSAPPAIVGIGKAFHVPGALPGESETQLFLLAAGGRPVSLSVVRRPGAPPAWGVSLGEIVDQAAASPARDTLLWYRLACALPRTLPGSSLAEAEPAQASAIRADYKLVLDALGPCTRTRRRA